MTWVYVGLLARYIGVEARYMLYEEHYSRMLKDLLTLEVASDYCGFASANPNTWVY
jgi:hypothetical protein